ADAVRAAGLPETPRECAALAARRVRELLHVAVCVDPAGDGLREVTRDFPALVGCTTIDWYDPWPRTALHAVARRLLRTFAQPAAAATVAAAVPSISIPRAAAGIGAEAAIDAQQRQQQHEMARRGLESVATAPAMAATTVSSAATLLDARQANALAWASVDVHSAVAAAAERLRERHGVTARAALTPQAYLCFQRAFLRLLADRHDRLATRAASLAGGVARLEQTAATVEALRAELRGLRPALEAAAAAAEEMLARSRKERAAAEALRAPVVADEREVQVRRHEVAKLRLEAQRELDRALPALDEALRALDSLKKDDIVEVKSFANPPAAVQTVMEAVCLLLGESTDWDSAKRVLGRASFMDELRRYDRDHVDRRRRAALRCYTQNEDMSVDRLRKVSVAAAGLCMWVHAMDGYGEVLDVCKPKMDAVAALDAALSAADAALQAKR
ncbi:unnamed protein product, partial [Phaeothamnion confervicola]